MWWAAALQQLQQEKDGAGGAQPLQSRADSSLGSLGFDSSNWTVATGGSVAGAGDKTMLYVGAALVGLVAVALIVRKS